jgi:hypothetical protein
MNNVIVSLENFDWRQYIANYKELKLINIDSRKKAYYHWLNIGRNEGKTYIDLNKINKPKLMYNYNNLDIPVKQFAPKKPIIETIDLVETEEIILKSKESLDTVETLKSEQSIELNVAELDLVQSEESLESEQPSDTSETLEPKELNMTELDLEKLEQLESYEKTLENDIEADTFFPRKSLDENLSKDDIDNNITPEDFDWRTYINNYSLEFKKLSLNSRKKAYHHWITIGKIEGKTYEDIKLFDWESYLSNYEDLRNMNICTKEQAWEHWKTVGKKQGRTHKKNIQNKINCYIITNIKGEEV